MNISSATIISILLLLFTICIDFEANFSIFIMIDIFSSLTHDDVILKWTLWLVTCYFLILATLRSDNIRIDEQTNIHEMFYGITIDCDFFPAGFCWWHHAILYSFFSLLSRELTCTTEPVCIIRMDIFHTNALRGQHDARTHHIFYVHIRNSITTIITM